MKESLRRLRILAVLSCLFVLAPCASAQDERAILTLIVNRAEKGTLIVRLRPPDVLVRASDLRGAGLTSFVGRHETVEQEDYVSLASLAPEITFRLDEERAALVLNVQPSFLTQTVLELKRRPPDGISYLRNTSSFLNYWATTGMGGVSLYSESGVSIRGNLLYNTLTRDTEGRVVRGNTNLTVDDRQHLRRWVVGDTFIGSSILGGATQLAGIAVSKNFDLDPYYIRFPSPTLSGAAASPSELEVYVNGTLVRRESVPPGPFELRNLPVMSGKGMVRILLRDASGREEEINTPYYFTPRILSPGQSEYAYGLGVQRTRPNENWTYGSVNFAGQHRYGFTESLTAGFRLEASTGTVSGGTTVTAQLPFGELDLGVAASRSDGGTGSAGSVIFTYLGPPVSFSGSVRLLSARYANLSLDPSKDRARIQIDGAASFAVGSRTALTLRHTTTKHRDQENENRESVLSSVRLTHRASLLLSGSLVRNGGQPARKELFVGINFSVGKNETVSISHQQGTANNTSLQFEKPLPAGTGLGYRVRTDVGQQARAGAVVQYNGAFGRYEAEFDRSGNSTRKRLTVAGGIVTLGGGIHLTRPVEQSFALIRLPRVAKVRGYAGNQEVGRTNTRGELLVPNLLSYYGNPIRIDAEDLPLNYSIDSAQQLIAPTFRGGAIVDFPVRRIQIVVGTLSVATAEGVVVPAYGNFTVTVGTIKATSPIGAQGEFYFESIPAGQHKAEIEYKDGTCSFVLDVPKSDEPFIDLGARRCAVLQPRQ